MDPLPTTSSTAADGISRGRTVGPVEMPVKAHGKPKAGVKARESSVAGAIASGVAARPIERQRLSERVSAQLEQLILSGQLPTGETLPSERHLMQLFGVGRTSIRASG